ncbi:MAG: 3-keto-5-aminohexanoate cleavage protein [Hyphomicrobiales bacterium]|nr:3-keto-5-aminohexanoate cleavage protein [Hyphomicrobiales bacterium]
MRKIIITCAVTGAADHTKINPAVPITPKQIANECLAANKAGAAIAHIHVRDPETGKPSMDESLYREVVDRIRQVNSDVIINLTTGPGARIVLGNNDNPVDFGPGTTLTSPANRVIHIENIKPDICSLDIGSFNFGPHIFVNSPDTVIEMAKKIAATGVKPELEVFDLGGIRQAKALIKQNLFQKPYLFQICLGIPWAAEASPDIMMTMKNHLPNEAVWSSFGISKDQLPMVAQSVILGGHVRVGLEDNLYLSRGELAPGNAPLVERALNIISNMGFSVATPSEAREILKI